MWLLGWMLACTCANAPDVRATTGVIEVFDVPPPPGHLTVRLDGVDPEGIPLGAFVAVRDGGGGLVARGDVVLDEQIPPSITVYVLRDEAEALLEGEGPFTVELLHHPGPR